MSTQYKPKIVMVLENLRSIHNVGAIIRTANGFGVHSFVFIGTTPYPQVNDDTRPPFMARKQTESIHKTALGAEALVDGAYYPNTETYLASDQNQNIVAIEQSDKSIPPKDYKCSATTVHLVLGNELDGVSQDLLGAATSVLEIPMQSTKESFNVEVAGAIVLYELCS